jgi:hypothetical protein
MRALPTILLTALMGVSAVRRVRAKATIDHINI